MENTMLVRKIYMECPLCDKTHEIEERKRIATTTLKGEKVAYEEHFYFCENADEEENELDKVSFVTIYQKAEEYMEDDTFVRTYWNCLYVE